MPANRRDLYLQLNASTAQFTAAMKSAAADLVQFDGNAEKTLDAVKARFEALGANDNPARALTESFRSAFAEIRRQGEQAIQLPATSAGAVNLGAEGAGQTAAAATAQATALREIADAAAQAAIGVTDTNSALRVYATAAAAAATAAERDALTLREQAAVLEQVQAKLDASGRSAVQTGVDLQKIAAAAEAVNAAGGRLSAGLAQQITDFGLSAEAIRANRVEAAALAAEQQGNAALAGELRGQLAQLVALEADAAAATARDAAAKRDAAEAERQFAAAVQQDVQNLRNLEQRFAADAAAVARYRELLDPATAAEEKRTQAIADARRVMQAYGFTAEEMAAVEQKLTATGDALSGAHGRMSSSGMILQHVVRATSDSYAAGLPIATIFTEQASRLSEAVAMMSQTSGATEGRMAKLAAFMSGAWGIGFTIGVAALSPLVAKLLESGDASEQALDKLKKEAHEADIARVAHDAFTRTLEGQIDAQRKLNEEIERGLKSQRQSDREALDQSTRDLGARQKDLAAAEADLAGKRRHVQYVVDHPTVDADPTTAAISQGASLIAANRDVTAALEKVDTLKRAVADAHQGIRDATVKIAVEDAKALVDPIVAINHRYDDMADAARKAALGNDRLAASLAGTLGAIESQRAAALKSQRDRDEAQHRAANDNRQTGREITLGDAEAIVRGIGGRITSAGRSTAEQQVLYDRYRSGTGPLAAKPGTSLHESGQALDIAKSPGMSLARIREAFQAQGVAIRELLDEGDHYHVGWGRKGKSGERQRDEQARTVQQSFDADAAFEGERRKLLDQLFGAGRAGATSDADRDLYQIQQINTDRDAEKKKIADQLGKALADPNATAQTNAIAQARAAELDGINEKVHRQKLENVGLERASQLIRDRFDAQERELSGAIDTLQLEDQLATTRRERLAIEREILDKERQRKQIEIDRVLADPKSTDRQRADARSDQTTLDRNTQLQVVALERKNEGPLAAYLRQLHGGVDDLNDALDGVKVDALKGLESELIGVVTGTESVAQAFKKMATSILADLAKIAIEKAIVSGIETLIPGAGALFSRRDGGRVPAFADGGLNGLFAGAGGPRDDKNLVLISNGEFIVNAAATRAHLPLLHAINDNRLPAFADGGGLSLPSVPAASIRYPTVRASEVARPASVRLEVAGNIGVKPAPQLYAEMQDLSVRTVAGAADPIMAGAKAQTLKAINRPALPGGYG